MIRLTKEQKKQNKIKLLVARQTKGEAFSLSSQRFRERQIEVLEQTTKDIETLSEIAFNEKYKIWL